MWLHRMYGPTPGTIRTATVCGVGISPVPRGHRLTRPGGTVGAGPAGNRIAAGGRGPCNLLPHPRVRSSGVERCSYKADVGGSKPSAPTSSKHDEGPGHRYRSGSLGLVRSQSGGRGRGVVPATSSGPAVLAAGAGPGLAVENVRAEAVPDRADADRSGCEHPCAVDAGTAGGPVPGQPFRAGERAGRRGHDEPLPHRRHLQAGYADDGSDAATGTTSASSRTTRIPPSRFTSYTLSVIATGLLPFAVGEGHGGP